ncbi:MAG: hypothetical protein HY289_08310 [Planctomycetes bacterium]|nr:hypothetical protein [Planctomycetota bacterium]
MTIRILSVVLALSMLIATGCRHTARCHPACPPAVVATTPIVPAPCPPGQLPPPPPAPFVPGPR